MISKISVENNTGIINSKIARKNKDSNNQTPSFKGFGGVILSGIQACEKMPMINVAVIDLLSAILPRTIVESMTNWFAGFEAFRRESSGLIVNCLIPSIITLGIAKCINPAFMNKALKEANMSNCWADRDLIDKTSELYTQSNSKDKAAKVHDVMKELIENIQGIDGNEKVLFKDRLSADKTAEYAKKLTELSNNGSSDREIRKEIKKISEEIVSKTHVAENINVKGVKASTVNSLLEDSVKYFKEFQKLNESSIEKFASQSKKMVRTKSLLGLAVVLPLAASMQYINRWITGKLSGTKGAPIYDDFGKDTNNEDKKSKEGLLKQKILSISSMLGVGLLSMMKMPSWKMLDFKGMFPTMDQARIISTCTFSSRMAAADDKNELAEATVRDIATFSSLYFLGDYAAKAAATLIQKSSGITLLNDTKPIEENASMLKKIGHWIKDVNIKSSDEVVSKTEQMLKGAAPTPEQAKIIEKELKHAVNLRSACQLTSIGVSLALLGVIIPVFTRRHTKKKHEQALKEAQIAQAEKQSPKTKVVVTPLNVDYSSLTAGFRAEQKKRA